MASERSGAGALGAAVVLTFGVVLLVAFVGQAPCHPDPTSCYRKIMGDGFQSQQISSSFTAVDLSIAGAAISDNGTLQAVPGLAGFVNFRLTPIENHPDEEQFTVTITIADGTPEVTWSDPLTRTFMFDPNGATHDERFDLAVDADAAPGGAHIDFIVNAAGSEFAGRLWFEVEPAPAAALLDTGSPLVLMGGLLGAGGAIAFAFQLVSSRPRASRVGVLAVALLALPLAGCVDNPGRKDLDGGDGEEEAEEAGEEGPDDGPLPYENGGDEAHLGAAFLVARVVLEGGTLKNNGMPLGEPAMAGTFNFNVTALEGVEDSGENLTIEIEFEEVDGLDWVGADSKTIEVDSDGIARGDLFFLFYIEDDPALTRVVADYTATLDGETIDGELTFDVA